MDPSARDTAGPQAADGAPLAGRRWIYPAQLVRVIDGETLDLRVSREVDFGFHVRQRLSTVVRFRLADIATPSVHEAPTRQIGLQCVGFVDQLLRTSLDLEVESFGELERGIWEADVRFRHTSGWMSLARFLVTMGYAVPGDAPQPSTWHPLSSPVPIP